MLPVADSRNFIRHLSKIFNFNVKNNGAICQHLMGMILLDGGDNPHQRYAHRAFYPPKYFQKIGGHQQNRGV